MYHLQEMLGILHNPGGEIMDKVGRNYHKLRSSHIEGELLWALCHRDHIFVKPYAPSVPCGVQGANARAVKPLARIRVDENLKKRRAEIKRWSRLLVLTATDPFSPNY